jgi:hypothetical protein
MRSTKVFAAIGVIVLTGAISLLPVQIAGAVPPDSAVLVPSNGATVSGTQVVLDAIPELGGTTEIEFELSGGGLAQSITIATVNSPSLVGWVTTWDSTKVPNGTYILEAVDVPPDEIGHPGAISITVDNPDPTVSIVVPSNGATVSGSQVLDAVASRGVTSVSFSYTGALCASGCTIGTATPTLYGWLYEWNTESIFTNDVLQAADQYTLSVTACYANEECGSNQITITVDDTPTMVLPANNHTVSGAVLLDCASPPGTNVVHFFIGGGTLSQQQLLGTATPTIYGYLYDWNTANWGDGIYWLGCNSLFTIGTSTPSAVIYVTLNNPQA